MEKGSQTEEWTDEELAVAIEVYFRKDLNESQKEKLLSELTGRKSVGFRLGNIKYKDKGIGFPNVGRNLDRAWAQFEQDRDGFLEKAKVLERTRMLAWVSGTSSEERELLECHPGEYREVVTKQRVHQDELRRKMLRCADKTCCLTEIKQVSMLRTSHIKDWSVCSDEEKTNLHNALCLNAFHDNLFDSYRMTIDQDMNVIYDPELEKTIPGPIYDSMIKPFTKIKVNDCNRPLPEFIEYHNRKFEEVTGIRVSKL